MRSKNFFVALVVVLSLVATASGEDKNVWSGFRGLEWGVNIRNTTGLKLERQEGLDTIYVREKDELAIGGAKLTSIFYVFHKSRFYGVRVTAKGASNRNAMKAAVFAHYGKGRQPNRFIEKWHWYQKNGVSMTLFYNESKEMTRLIMYYMPIVREISRMRHGRPEKPQGISDKQREKPMIPSLIYS